MGLLDGKVVVLSGVGPGLGRSLGEVCADEGADLVLVSRTEKRLEKAAAAVAERGRRAVVVPADITDPDACRRIVDRTLEELGTKAVAIALPAGVIALVGQRDQRADVADTGVRVTITEPTWTSTAGGTVHASCTGALRTSMLVDHLFPAACVAAPGAAPARYRLRTRHAKILGGAGPYLMQAEEVLRDIGRFVADHVGTAA